MVEPELIEEKIRAALSDAEIEIQDMTGTKDHYRVLIVSPDFEGKNRIEQRRMVYDIFAEEMKGPIHALDMKTFTPQEWAKLQDG